MNTEFLNQPSRFNNYQFFLRSHFKGKRYPMFFFRNIQCSEFTKDFFRTVGLPLDLQQSPEILPFTYFPILNENGKEYYILGQCGMITGPSFFAIKNNDDKVYHIYKFQTNSPKINLAFENLYTMFVSIVLFKQFMRKYSIYEEEKIVNTDIVKDYSLLLKQLDKVDRLNQNNVFNLYYFANVIYDFMPVSEKLEVVLKERNKRNSKS